MYTTPVCSEGGYVLHSGLLTFGASCCYFFLRLGFFLRCDVRMYFFLVTQNNQNQLSNNIAMIASIDKLHSEVHIFVLPEDEESWDKGPFKANEPLGGTGDFETCNDNSDIQRLVFVISGGRSAAWMYCKKQTSRHWYFLWIGSGSRMSTNQTRGFLGHRTCVWFPDTRAWVTLPNV